MNVYKTNSSKPHEGTFGLGEPEKKASVWNQKKVEITLGVSAALIVIGAVAAGLLSHYGYFGHDAQHFINVDTVNWFQDNGIALGVGAGVGLIGVGAAGAIIVKKKKDKNKSEAIKIKKILQNFHKTPISTTKKVIIAVSILFIIGAAVGAGFAAHYGIFGGQAQTWMQSKFESFFIHTVPHFTLKTIPHFTMKTALPWLDEHKIALGIGAAIGSMIAGVTAYQIHCKIQQQLKKEEENFWR